MSDFIRVQTSVGSLMSLLCEISQSNSNWPIKKITQRLVLIGAKPGAIAHPDQANLKKEVVQCGIKSI